MDRNKRIVFPLLVLVLFAITADEYRKWSTGYFCKIGYSFLSDQTNGFSHAISPVITNNPFTSSETIPFPAVFNYPLVWILFSSIIMKPDPTKKRGGFILQWGTCSII